MVLKDPCITDGHAVSYLKYTHIPQTVLTDHSFDAPNIWVYPSIANGMKWQTSFFVNKGHIIFLIWVC